MRGASRQAFASAVERLDVLLADTDFESKTARSEGLLAVARLLGRERPLLRSLADPGVSVGVRRTLVDAVFGGEVDEIVLDLLRGVVADRWSSPDDALDVIEALGVQAAFAAAEQDGTLDDVEDQLFRFARIVDGAPALRAGFADPAVPVERKRELVRTLLSGKATPTTIRLVDAVVIAPRGRALDHAVDALAESAAARRKRKIAVVRVAVALSEDRRGRLTAALAAAIGQDVRLHVQIDPEIRGGVIVRIGDEVFDGSISHRLEQSKSRLSR